MTKLNLSTFACLITLAVSSAQLVTVAFASEFPPTIRIEVPQPTVLIGQCADYCWSIEYGRTHFGGGRPGDSEFFKTLDRRTKTVKLLIYRPGSMMFTATVNVENLPHDGYFAPQFKRVPMVPITIRVVDKAGRPAPGVLVTLKVDMDANTYMTPEHPSGPIQLADVLIATTDDSGTIVAEVPSLPDDPYFFKRGRSPYAPARRDLYFYTSVFQQYIASVSPELRIPALDKYPEPVIFTVTWIGAVNGTVENSFFTKQGLDPASYLGDAKKPLSQVLLRKQSDKSSILVPFHSDGYSNGRFWASVPEGTYDLSIVPEQKDGLTELPTGVIVTVREKETASVSIR